MKAKRWTNKEATKMAKTFLRDDESHRYRKAYSGVEPESRSLFYNDARSRARAFRREAKIWWDKIQKATGTDDLDRLVLAEPFAQHGCTVDDLFRQLPKEEKVSDDALLRAWRRIKDPDAMEGITNTAGWQPEKLSEYLCKVRDEIGWDNTTGSARKWWEAFEKESKQRLSAVVRLAEELKLRKATITDFFLAYVYSNTDNIRANLYYLDYTRLKKEEERRKREAGGNDWKPTWELNSFRDVPHGVTDSNGWSKRQIRALLQKAKENSVLDLKNTTGSALKWWENFEKESESRPELVLRFVEELNRRKATITEFFLAYVYSNTDNLQANLHYLDYIRLKKEEERKRREETTQQSKLGAT